MTSMGPPPPPQATSEEPPAKKPKLKLTVRNPEASPSAAPTPTPAPAPAPSPAPTSDIIAVSRPRRNSVLRIRYSEDMVLEDESLRIHESDSSDLSELEATPPPGNDPRPAKQKTPNDANPDYGDFMSYYILDGDEDKPKAGAAKPKAAPKPRQQGPSQPRHQERAQQQMQAQHNNHVRQQQQYPPIQHRPPPPPPPPLPQVQLIDFDQFSRPEGPREPDTVLQMVQKLEALSTALTNFGGVPSVPKSQSPKAESTNRPRDHVHA